MKRLMLMMFSAVCSLAATGLHPYWAGKAKLPDGSSPAVYLTLREQGESITGSFAYGDETRRIPLEKAEFKANQLTFEIHDNPDRLAAFQLTLTGDGLLKGEVRSGNRVIEVELSPVEPAGAFHVGPTITAPVLLYKIEPDYTEEARAAKVQGTVTVYAQVNPSGQAINMRVLRGLGFGLDEKAIEAVKQWKFKPGMKDDRPVTVEVQIEVNFRLLVK